MKANFFPKDAKSVSIYDMNWLHDKPKNGTYYAITDNFCQKEAGFKCDFSTLDCQLLGGLYLSKGIRKTVDSSKIKVKNYQPDNYENELFLCKSWPFEKFSNQDWHNNGFFYPLVKVHPLYASELLAIGALPKIKFERMMELNRGADDFFSLKHMSNYKVKFFEHSMSEEDFGISEDYKLNALRNMPLPWRELNTASHALEMGDVCEYIVSRSQQLPTDDYIVFNKDFETNRYNPSCASLSTEDRKKIKLALKKISPLRALQKEILLETDYSKLLVGGHGKIEGILILPDCPAEIPVFETFPFFSLLSECVYNVLKDNINPLFFNVIKL